jgi:two-component system response regulator FlrC
MKMTPTAPTLTPMAEHHLLLIEDDPELREALLSTLRRAGFRVSPVASAEEGLMALSTESIDLVVSDIRLPGMNGLELLNTLRGRPHHPPTLLMTAFADAPLAIVALKAGARELLLKPFSTSALVEVVRRHLAPSTTSSDPNLSASGLLCTDARMRATVTRAERAAVSDASVLLTGESGVGKEVMARHIHMASRRADGAFVAVNCAAIPDSLLEATLFGHEKGSFTGATRQQPGKFEQAHGGTLFLDEIGEMAAGTQVKLLRVLQERTVERLGGQQSIAIDIRLITATNRDLSADVASGRFREDLFYRLAVFPVPIPPLRERPGDIVPLARRFVQRYSASFGLPDRRLSPASEAALCLHRWPGNVRELENTIQRGLLLSEAPWIEPAHLELPSCEIAQVDVATTQAAQTTAVLPLNAVSMVPGAPLASPEGPEARARNVRDVEREHILGVLRQVAGNRRAAIAILGISERALRYKLKAYREQSCAPSTDRLDADCAAERADSPIVIPVPSTAMSDPSGSCPQHA